MQLMRDRYWIPILFLGSLLARIGFYYLFLRNNPIALAYDSGHYHAVAQQLVLGHGFSNPDSTPHFYRLPGYPCFLALCYLLFGIDYHWALAVQLVVASLIPVVGFYLARQLVPTITLVAPLVGLVLAVHPGFLLFSGLVMSETLYILIFLLFLLLFFYVLQHTHAAWWLYVSAGLVLGLASLVRPVGVPLALMLSGAIWLADVRWRGLCNGGLLLIGWCAVVGLWVVRNALLTGVLFLHTLSGPHYVNHGAVRVVANAKNMPYTQAQSIMQQRLQIALAEQRAHKGAELCAPEVTAVMEREAYAVFCQHPVATFKLCLINSIKTVLSLYTSELLCIDAGGALPSYDPTRGWGAAVMRYLKPVVHNRSIVWFMYVEMILHLLLLLGCVGYCYQLWRGRWPVIPSLVMLAIIALVVGLSCLCGFARLRLPIEPLLVLMAISFYCSAKTT